MMPSFTGVVAMAANRAIGIQQRIPWHLPEDLRTFKRLTLGHPILMGRNTWESLGRPLPGRQNIVLTRNPAYTAPGAIIIRTLGDLATLDLQHPEVMVIGGAQIYELLLPQLQRLWVSAVHGQYEADTYFPPFQSQFTRCSLQEQHEGFDLLLYER